MTYFCGSEWECGDINSKKALQMAKVLLKDYLLLVLGYSGSAGTLTLRRLYRWLRYYSRTIYY